MAENCENCGKAEYINGPFDTKDGAFIYCPKCGHNLLRNIVLPDNAISAVEKVQDIYEAKLRPDDWFS